MGAIGATVLVGDGASSKPDAWSGPVRPAGVQTTTVDTTRPDWTPHIAFLSEANRLESALVFEANALPLSLPVMAAGLPKETTTLVSETWHRNRGWAALAEPEPRQITLKTPILDPSMTEGRLVPDVTLPISGPGQALLYIVREWTRVDGSVVPLRSNPLLVTVYEEEKGA